LTKASLWKSPHCAAVSCLCSISQVPLECYHKSLPASLLDGCPPIGVSAPSVLLLLLV
jgi:hypothetical protein